MASQACDPATHVEALLRIGDSALVLAQRLGELVGNAPTLEEELATANIALDLLGQATMMLEHAGVVEGAGRDADQLAYLRDTSEWHNLLLVERPNGDFAVTVLRQLLYSAWALELWTQLLESTDAELAAIAGKAVKECSYHVEHAGQWIARLGDGTEESRSRLLAALEDLWPYAREAFIGDEVDAAASAAGITPEPASLEAGWRDRLAPWLAQAGVELPEDGFTHTGGRQGRHTEHLGYLLAELQFLQRAYPGASW